MPADGEILAEDSAIERPVDRSLLYVEGHVAWDTNVSEITVAALPRDRRGGPQGEWRVWRDEKGAPMAESNPIPVRESWENWSNAPFDSVEQGRMVASPKDATTFFKPPNIVGFYVETTPQSDMDSRSEDLEELVLSFRKGLLDQGVPEEALALDFVFDPERQFRFESRGMLASKQAVEAVRGDDALKQTRSWLRGEEP